MSGIECNDTDIQVYNTFKLQNSRKDVRYSYLVYRIIKDGGKEVIKLMEKKERADKYNLVDEWSNFVESLQAKVVNGEPNPSGKLDGAYGIFDFYGDVPDPDEPSNLLNFGSIIFVAWAPDSGIGVKSKMLYGSTRESFKSALGSGISLTVQASDMAAVDLEKVTRDLKSVKGRKFN